MPTAYNKMLEVLYLSDINTISLNAIEGGNE